MLLQRYFREHDREAMTELFNRHVESAYRFALAITGNTADAEEVVQTAFVQILAHSSTDISNVRGWIMRIVADAGRNKVKSEANLHKREKLAAAERASESSMDDEKAELAEAAVHAVKTLPIRYRWPVWLHYIEGLSFDEIGMALSQPEGTVRQQANRGLEEIRQSLAAAGFTATAVVIPGLLASIPLTPVPETLSASIKTLIAAKAAGAGMTAGTHAVKTKGGLSLMAKASIALAVITVASATALVLSKSNAEDTPKDPPVKAPAGEPAKPEATSSAEFGKFFGPQQDWPRFRGPLGNGVCTEKNLPIKWNAKTGENILWSSDVPYGIYPQYPFASPIVYKDKVFISLGHIEPAEHKVACFNKSDGKLLWMTAVKAYSGSLLTTNEHVEDFCHTSAATPCTDGERVYVVFATGVVAALDYAGKVIWRQEIIKLLNLPQGRGGPLGGGLASSPVLYKDMLIVDSSMGSIAFDGKTGEVRYRENRKNSLYCYPSAIPVTIKGTPWLLNRVNETVSGINPETGKTIWFVKDSGRDLISSLGAGDGILFSSQRAAAWTLDALANASGELKDDSFKWKLDNKYSTYDVHNRGYNSPVVCGGCVYYLIHENGAKGNTLVSVDAATGKVNFEEKLDLHDSGATADLLATTDGYIYFTSAQRTVVTKVVPTFEIVANNELDDGGTRTSVGGYSLYNSAAVSEGKIFILGYQKLWCIGKK